MTSKKNWSKEELVRRCTRLERENKELQRLQATYSITLSGFLLEQHEMMTQRPTQPGEEIKYFIPIDVLHRISESDIAIKTQNKEGKIGADISLILAKPTDEGNGEEQTQNNGSHSE